MSTSGDCPGIPHLLNYQGVLNESDGTYQMTFGIYDSATGGNLLWSETQNVQVSDGRFNVLLGGVTPIPSDVFQNGPDRWLGVKVGSDAEMTPRQRIVSVAYAYVAECAQTIVPGQGLEIKDAEGNETHRWNANGTSWHAGRAIFDGGIDITGPHESKIPEKLQSNIFAFDGGIENTGPHESPSWTIRHDADCTTYYDKQTGLTMKTFSDGTEKIWHKNGKLGYQKNPDGTEKEWDENGNLMYRFDFTHGGEYWYYEDGTLKKFVDPECEEIYNEKGDLIRREWMNFRTGTKTVYDGDGNIIREENMEGSIAQTGQFKAHKEGHEPQPTVLTDTGLLIHLES